MRTTFTWRGEVPLPRDDCADEAGRFFRAADEDVRAERTADWEDELYGAFFERVLDWGIRTVRDAFLGEGEEERADDDPDVVRPRALFREPEEPDFRL